MAIAMATDQGDIHRRPRVAKHRGAAEEQPRGAARAISSRAGLPSVGDPTALCGVAVPPAADGVEDALSFPRSPWERPDPLRPPSYSGGWQLRDLDLSERLVRYRDHEIVAVSASTGKAEQPACGLARFEPGE